nr:hypothetical protein [Neisseria sicca]
MASARPTASRQKMPAAISGRADIVRLFGVLFCIMLDPLSDKRKGRLKTIRHRCLGFQTTSIGFIGSTL